jgi:hypothetical protein
LVIHSGVQTVLEKLCGRADEAEERLSDKAAEVQTLRE